MNHYYISAARGSDSAGDGSATSPWKTIGKAIGPGPAAALGADGARVFIEPGTYREAVALALTPTAGAPLEIVGDCDGAGFLAGGRAEPMTGVVDWSAWADDFTPSTTTPCLNVSGKGHVTLRGLKMHGGNYTASCLYLNGACPSWILRDVIFVAYPNKYAVLATPPGGAPVPLLVDGCDFHSPGSTGVQVNVDRSASEYPLGHVYRNCRFNGVNGVVFSLSGTGLNIATGITIEHCSFLATTTAITVYNNAGGMATVEPLVVRGCLFVSTYGILAGNVANVAEDWNDFCCTVPRTNTAAGANSRSPVRPAVEREDGRLVGVPLRPMGTPTPGSPLAGRVGSGPYPARDFTGRARPEGLGSALPATGALERHDTGEPDVAHADAGSSGCLALRGPASLERPILVDATTTTISVKVRWDGNHGDTKKPRAVLLANPEIGVAADQMLIATSTGGSGSTPNAYETLTFAPVTPTRAGALMLRLASRSTTGHGVAYFDSIVVS
ncbi:hypothetical protein [Paludisphaera sp.]|uniref:hypothetical protein n=1 Tax=Paludisphaera sp. TaxID=2017432 RepID=UPI00301C232A